MDRSFNIEAVNSIASLMSDLADLYSELGGLTAAAEIRKNEHFIKKVVVSFICDLQS